MSESVITVKLRKGFTVLPNSTLRDNRLSLKTRAILAIMVSMPDDWDYTVSGLATICDVGKDAVRTSLRELEACGYLIRKQQHNEAGHFRRNEYIVTDEPTGEGDTPLSGYPSTAEPSTGEPLTDNPTQQNKDCTNNPYSPPKGDGAVDPSKKNNRRSRGPKIVPEWKPERFARFWDYYPRGENKQRAIQAWDRLKPSDELIDEMAQALKRQMQSDSWRAGVGIPYASTWLNNRRWEDEIKTSPTSVPGSAWAEDPEVM